MSLTKYPYTPKVWGGETELVNNEKYCGKILHLKPGYRCSLHMHRLKTETFFVLDGNVKLETHIPGTLVGLDIDATHNLQVGDNYHLEPLVYHRFQAIGEEATILEISTPHYDSDSYRLEESGPIPK